MTKLILTKSSVTDLASFGGEPLFTNPISTSNLVQPEIESFLGYSKIFFDNKQYTNNGELVRILENRLADFHESRYCVAVCSGFWGLALTMKTLAIKGKKEVIMPSLTYRRMADIAAWCGLVPRFCEVDPDTLAMTSATVSDCITEETALIMAVHPIVNCCDVEGIDRLAEECRLPVLFDGVESAYETNSAGRVGSRGNAECFSLHASKLLNGFEGGYITTNDYELAEKLKKLRTFGFEGKDKCLEHGGLNAKLNEIHAAMALANLESLDKQIQKNLSNYRAYQRCLKSISAIRLLEFDEAYSTSYKNIVVELLPSWPYSRDLTVRLLNNEGILARAYYSPALHQKPMRYPYVDTQLPITESLALRYILMPCGDFVGTAEIEQVVKLLRFLDFESNTIKSALLNREGGG